MPLKSRRIRGCVICAGSGGETRLWLQTLDLGQIEGNATAELELRFLLDPFFARATRPAHGRFELATGGSLSGPGCAIITWPFRQSTRHPEPLVVRSMVHVHMLPSLIPPGELDGGVAVVIDVLRATTMIVHALVAG